MKMALRCQRLFSNRKFNFVSMLSPFCSAVIDVVHEPKNNRFVIHLDKGECVLDYLMTKKTIDLYHTEVPEVYRGKGVAKQLVKEAIKYARENSLKVIPTCEYVQKYLNENPIAE
ncbi:protein NATD1-like [Hydra vulgaris]|uniref:Protein NATD1 n=1 Tax=Hydra vulgaris TaxID=6087 RepID=T2M9X2_HYDVU